MNISADGARIYTTASLVVGEIIRFHSSDCYARVAWTRANEAGLLFIQGDFNQIFQTAVTADRIHNRH